MSTKEFENWRTALREHRKKVDMTYDEIAERINTAPKTVARVFNGEAKGPDVNLINDIIRAMGTTWGDIFGESSAVITTENVDKLQAEINRLSARLEEVESELSLTQIKLEYEQKINRLFEFFTEDKQH